MSDKVVGHQRAVIIMPARNSAKTLEDTFKAIPPGAVDRVFLVDNASRDDTVAIAERLGITVVKHPVDRGYGGSLKTCLRTALADGADLILELHPDNQYDPAFIPDLLAKARSDTYAIVIGSRFIPATRALEGGMPWWKFVANRTLTLLNGLLVGVRLSEFHTGYRVYNAKWVRTLDLNDFSDDFLLGFQTLARAAEDGWRLGEVPAYSRYFQEASSNPLVGSTIYGLGTLMESVKVFGRRMGLGARGRAL